MIGLRRSVFALAATAAILMFVVPTSGDAIRHLRLVKSEPAKDAVVEHAPETVRLYFSEAPEIKVTTLKITGESGQETKLGAVAALADDAKVVTAKLESHPAPGTYTVAWRTMSGDGHVVSGEYSFRIKAAQ